jgi:hypothetical protein
LKKTLAYRQGREAAMTEMRTGKIAINPYNPETQHYIDWEIGYLDEFEIDD